MNCGYNNTPVTSVSTTLLLLQIFPSLSIPYLYVLELKTCVDKKVSEGSILWTGNASGNEDDEGVMNLMVTEAMITSKIIIMMTTKTMIWSKVNTRSAMVFLKFGLFQLSKSRTMYENS